MIQIRQDSGGDPLTFTVTIREGKSETRHAVTMAKGDFARLSAGKHKPTEVIDAAFRFLLDREPKEAILARFDVTVISRYFPDFASTLPRYLSPPGK
jgi:hypothetical protein